ncbi:MAG: DUF6799 domain-containing protein [Verrucomicrobiota bacterium]
MKFKSIITSAFMGIACSSIAHAQQGTAEATSTLKEDLRGNPSKVDSADDVAKQQDAIVVKDGTLMVRKDSKLSPMETDMTLTDGSIVLMDGSVKTPEGNVVLLNSGDEVALDGKILKRDILVFRESKMMIKRDGKVMPMTEPTIIGNGTQVMLDGSIVMKDGDTKTLKDGQQIDWDGRIKDGDIVDAGPRGKRP